jgi:hypothetical protein
MGGRCPSARAQASASSVARAILAAVYKLSPDLVPPATALERLPEEWSAQLEQWGEPTYRGKQVFEWLHRRGVLAPDAMTNLPRSLRERLADDLALDALARDRIEVALALVDEHQAELLGADQVDDDLHHDLHHLFEVERGVQLEMEVKVIGEDQPLAL